MSAAQDRLFREMPETEAREVVEAARREYFAACARYEGAADAYNRIWHGALRPAPAPVDWKARFQGYADAARAELLSDDPNDTNKYFKREARDRRFDAVVSAAREIKPMPEAIADRIVQSYVANLSVIKNRAEAEGLKLDPDNFMMP